MSNNNIAVKDNDETVVLENTISLKQFPPKLRKVGKELLKTNEPLTIKDACDRVNVNYDSIRTLIWKHKKKGNDFNQYIETIADSYLQDNLIAVDKATLNGAVSGTHQDRKLYYERIGKLKDGPQVNIGTLAIGVNISGLSAGDNSRDKGTIDITPTIPKDKGD